MQLRQTSQIDRGTVRRRRRLRRRIYGGDGDYVEPFPDSERLELVRPQYPGRQRHFRVERDGQTAACAVARVSRRLRDDDGRAYGLIGHFEAERDAGAVRRLLGACVDWLRGQGAGPVVGPVDGDTWHEYRLNLGPFDERAFLMEPYNPDYYPFLWAAAGFEVGETYHSVRVPSVEAAREGLRDKYEKARQRGYRFEPLDLGALDEELRRVYRMTRRIFADNYLYTDIDFESFRSLYDGVERIADPGLTRIAVGPDGEDAGYLFAVPDCRRALAAMEGEKTAWAALKFAVCRRRTETANIKTVGVMPAHRRRGLAGALAYRSYAAMAERGYERANICLIRDGNHSARLEGGTGEVLRRYGLYRSRNPELHSLRSFRTGLRDRFRDQSPEGRGANVIRHLTRAARRWPERPALVEDGASITFGELHERVDRLAAGFDEAGFGSGDRAVVMVPMSVEMYAVLMAVLKVGGQAVFVDPWIGARQIAEFAAYAEPDAFVGVPKSHLVRLLDGKLRRIPLSVTTGRRLWMFPAGRTVEELEADGGVETDPTAPGETALITFTSGSSGAPKGTDRTHGLLSAQHRALSDELPGHDGVDMPTFPVFALDNLAGGVTTVIPDIDLANVSEADPEVVLEQMHRHGVTTATASPPLFDRLVEYVDDHPAARPDLRRIVTGGAPVTDEQLRRWKAVFSDTEIVVLYGSTEAEPVAHIRAEERLSVEEPAGRPAPGFCTGELVDAVDAKVVEIRDAPIPSVDDWASIELERGAIGELVVAGDHVCEGYFRNPEATADNKIVGPEGRIWHRMGDTGYLDGDGRFWLCGRVHSTIRRDGRAIHPQLVEQVVARASEDVDRVAAVGLPDAEVGERLAVVVEAEEPDGVLASAREALEAAGVPVDRLQLASEPLPTDPRHDSKIDYGAMKERMVASTTSTRRLR